MAFSIQVVALAGILAVAGSCSAQCSQPAQGAKSVLYIDASPVHRRVTLGSSVLLKVRMTNISRHDVSVWLEKGGAEAQYEVDVRDQKRSLPAETEYGKKRNGHVHLEMLKLQDLIGSGACVPLKHGQTMVHEINISKLYDLGAPGKYFIRVQTADPESAAMVKSNTVRVTVTP
jgi:hypothetical protein